MQVHLMQLSDIHLTGGCTLVGERDPAERLAVVLAAARLGTAQADALVLTGDLTEDGSRSACEQLAAALAPLRLPILAVPGNHDDPRVIRDVFGADVLEVGGWRIIGVDTTRPDQVHGTVDVPREMSRLDEYDRRPTVLAMHHPPVAPSAHPWFRFDGAAEFEAEIARRPHVRAMLTGHLHHPFDASAGGATLLGGPSTLIAFRLDGDDVVIGGADTTGARMITLHDEGTVTSSLIQA